jgi:hypothetical protein
LLSPASRHTNPGADSASALTRSRLFMKSAITSSRAAPWRYRR